MGLFEWLDGWKDSIKSQPPSSLEMTSLIASTFDGVITKFGPEKVLAENFCIILDTKNRISAYWGSNPQIAPHYKSSVRVADIDEMDTVRQVLSPASYEGMPSEQAKELRTEYWRVMRYALAGKVATAILNRP